jgi:hypothetical protein
MVNVIEADNISLHVTSQGLRSGQLLFQGLWMTAVAMPVCRSVRVSTANVRQRTESPSLSMQRVYVGLNWSGVMGKYLVAWLLGVPVFVLVIVYFIF